MLQVTEARSSAGAPVLLYPQQELVRGTAAGRHQQASGPGGLEDRPSIPREPALKTPDAVADRLVLARKGHPS
ncbi:MAG: hypothetical protein HY720_09090, partial [Planctomycetes bacterium]|nr:hypothetical protein [Planctomycetota bacterium]